jgi:hypothetical protein
MDIRVEINEFYYRIQVVFYQTVYVSMYWFIIDFGVDTYVYTLYYKRPLASLSNLDVCLKYTGLS